MKMARKIAASALVLLVSAGCLMTAFAALPVDKHPEWGRLCKMGNIQGIDFWYRIRVDKKQKVVQWYLHNTTNHRVDVSGTKILTLSGGQKVRAKFTSSIKANGADWGENFSGNPDLIDYTETAITGVAVDDVKVVDPDAEELRRRQDAQRRDEEAKRKEEEAKRKADADRQRQEEQQRQQESDRQKAEADRIRQQRQAQQEREREQRAAEARRQQDEWRRQQEARKEDGMKKLRAITSGFSMTPPSGEGEAIKQRMRREIDALDLTDGMDDSDVKLQASLIILKMKSQADSYGSLADAQDNLEATRKRNENLAASGLQPVPLVEQLTASNVERIKRDIREEQNDIDQRLAELDKAKDRAIEKAAKKAEDEANAEREAADKRKAADQFAKAKNSMDTGNYDEADRYTRDAMGLDPGNIEYPKLLDEIANRRSKAAEAAKAPAPAVEANRSADSGNSGTAAPAAVHASNVPDGCSGSDWLGYSSPDGKLITYIDPEKGKRWLSLWDVAACAKRCTIEPHVFAVAFSPDGRIVASGREEGGVKLWRTDNGSLIRAIKGKGFDSTVLAFSPDGGMLAVGSDGAKIRILSVATGKLIRTCKGDENGVTSLRFSPDGKLLLAETWNDGPVRLLNVATGKLIYAVKAGEHNQFSADSRLIAGRVSNHDLLLCSALTGKPIRTIPAYQYHVDLWQFSPDGEVIVATGYDATCNSPRLVRAWRVSDGQLIGTFDNGDAVISLRFSGDGSTVTVIGWGSSKQWDLSALRSGQSRTDSPDAVRLAADAEGLIASRDYAKAEASAREAVRLASGNAGFHKILGDSLFWQSKLSESEREYREAIRLEPESATAGVLHANIGWILYQQRRYADAEPEMREAVRRIPDSADRHAQLGLILLAQSKNADAEKELSEAIRLDSKNPNYPDWLKQARSGGRS